MSVLIAPETPYGQELWKWEHYQDETCPHNPAIRGMRSRIPLEYPALMYRATQKNPWQFERVMVNTEVERRNAESRGFVWGGQGKAAEAYDALVQEAAVAAAERNYSDRNMSAKAKAERDAVEQASSRHLGEIPETPIRKRRGRKPKAQAEAVPNG